MAPFDDIEVRFSPFKLMAFFIMAQTLILCGLIVFLVGQHSKTQDLIAANRQATTYVCNTSNVLKVIAATSVAQIEKDFRNGSYAALLEKGIVTQKEVNDARHDLQVERNGLTLLENNRACVNLITKS